jgi:hypothetical protein
MKVSNLNKKITITCGVDNYGWIEYTISSVENPSWTVRLTLQEARELAQFLSGPIASNNKGVI